MNEKTFDYLFIDLETGEEFFVETDKGCYFAKKEAQRWFREPIFEGKFSPEEADILGYDTY